MRRKTYNCYLVKDNESNNFAFVIEELESTFCFYESLQDLIYNLIDNCFTQEYKVRASLEDCEIFIQFEIEIKEDSDGGVLGNCNDLIYNMRKIKVVNHIKEERNKDLIEITKLMYEKFKKNSENNLKENYNIEFGNITYKNSFGFFLFLFIIVLFEFITNRFPINHLIDRDYFNINLEDVNIDKLIKELNDLLINEEGVSNNDLTVYMSLKQQKEHRLVLNENNNSLVVTAYKKS